VSACINWNPGIWSQYHGLWREALCLGLKLEVSSSRVNSHSDHVLLETHWLNCLRKWGFYVQILESSALVSLLVWSSVSWSRVLGFEFYALVLEFYALVLEFFAVGLVFFALGLEFFALGLKFLVLVLRFWSGLHHCWNGINMTHTLPSANKRRSDVRTSSIWVDLMPLIWY